MLKTVLDHRAQFLASSTRSDFLPLLLARARNTKLTTSLRKSFGLLMPAFFQFFQLVVNGRGQKFRRFRVAIFLILNPEVRIGYVTVEDVLAVFGV